MCLSDKCMQVEEAHIEIAGREFVHENTFCPTLPFLCIHGNFLSMKIDIQATRRHSMRDCSIIASTVR